jgi:HD-GYP domain-containing protein (c-di-GMP phosphodiesterase class II)
MVDFSNIFENKADDKNTPKDTSDKGGYKSPIEFSELFMKTIPAKEPPTPIKQEILPKVESKKEVNDQDCSCEAKSVYQHAIIISEKIFESNLDMTVDEIESILLFVETIINALRTDDISMIACVFRYAPSEKINPYALKLINVCILSIEIGMELNYNNVQLTQLAVAAFLHDIGLKKYTSIINQTRKLTPKEKKDLENYPTITKEILTPLKGVLGNDIFTIIEQCSHVTPGTTNINSGIKGSTIPQAAQIIALADTYEALTHARPYRIKYTPLEAIKIILADKGTFDPRLSKILLDRIGLYPKGTFVELSTKEIAQVLRQNPRMPTSPVVKIIYDDHGQKLDSGREINLAKETEVFINKQL